ncbi:MAG: helix-turn-helix domain-containing protein [Caulobacteraceae bacterium]
MSGSLYTVEQTAERLRLHPKTVLRMIRDGRLKAKRIGKAYRILGDDLDAAAGVVRAEAREATDRTTVIADFGDLRPEVAGRFISMMTASLNSREARADPIRLEAAYDPDLRRVKLVVIGPPADCAALLKMAVSLLEAWR